MKAKIKEILESYLNVNDTIYSRDIPLIVEEFSSLKAEKSNPNKEQELRSIIHEVIWQYCYGKGGTDALFNYQDIDAATNEIVEQYFQPEAEPEKEVSDNIADINFIKWYSGMEEVKIRRAFERYKKEAHRDNLIKKG